MDGNLWQERAVIGEALSSRAGDSDADRRLLTLLLDPDDTAVIVRTTAALLQQRSAPALRLVVVAASRADENQNDWIGEALDGFLDGTPRNDAEWLQRELGSLHTDPDPAVARTARTLSEWYTPPR